MSLSPGRAGEPQHRARSDSQSIPPTKPGRTRSPRPLSLPLLRHQDETTTKHNETTSMHSGGVPQAQGDKCPTGSSCSHDPPDDSVQMDGDNPHPKLPAGNTHDLPRKGWTFAGEFLVDHKSQTGYPTAVCNKWNFGGKEKYQYHTTTTLSYRTWRKEYLITLAGSIHSSRLGTRGLAWTLLPYRHKGNNRVYGL